MQIQPIVIGTAGHIDHGKSTLVRALTGIDPDRLKEEKERGLTIDLGFAPFVLPDGRRVGMVDVPGHERFLRNMVAGATGIDLVLLCIAADDGVMPQTREHLQIMQLLGLQRGLVALTKSDSVDADLLELAIEDVRALLEGTFLENAPIVPVSALTGAGLDALRGELAKAALETTPRTDQGVFRMSVQRVFSAKGFGTVLTGIPVSGALEIGATVELQPGGLTGKVRGLHAYGASVTRVRAGHSSAINVSDIPLEAAHRGMVLAQPGYFRPQRLLAARLLAIEGLPTPLENRTRIRLHTGTADPAGELVLLDVAELEAGGTALVQLRLDEPVVCAPGDRFLLRLLSPERTLGGGVILEESRWRLKRFKNFVIEDLARAEQSLDSPLNLLEALLSRRGAALSSAEELSLDLKRPPEEVRELLESLRQDKRARLVGKSQRWMHPAALERALADLETAVAAFFAQHAHRGAAEALAVRGLTRFAPELFQALCEHAAQNQKLVLEAGGKLRPAGRELSLDPKTRALHAAVATRLEATPFAPPTPAELAQQLSATEKEVKRVLELLADEGRARHVGDGLWFAQSALERAREAVVENCNLHGHLEIPALRDRFATTRKYLIPLLEFFDAQGVTMRQGANRVLKKR